MKRLNNEQRMSKTRLDNRIYESDIKDIHLLIEITDHCNCRCVMCRQSKLKSMHGNIPKQYMDMGLFVKIINDIKDEGMEISSIDPLWCGESIVHPDFKEMMHYLFTMNKSYNLFKGFILNTNAIAMDEELSNVFLDYAKFINQMNDDKYYMTLYFSLDAIFPETYQKIKNVQGKNLDKVIKNIQYLVKKRKERNLIFPNLVFAFIVMQENAKEAVAFGKFWKNFLESMNVSHVVTPFWKLLTDRDTVYFRQLLSYRDSKENEKLHRKACSELGISEESKNIVDEELESGQSLRRPCSALWRTPNISPNGDVVPCCRDVELTMVLGNVKKESLKDIWSNNKITELRIAHIKGEFSISPLCLYCSEPTAGLVSDEQIYQYLQSVNKPELMEMYLNRK
jgi:radical SAM protein with 4Fe4S-binding SPASM domain